MEDLISTFLKVYSVLKSELLEDPAFEWTDDSRKWIERMLDYNAPGGNLSMGLSFMQSYKLLIEGKELIEDEIFRANTLGWCIEWLQAYFLVHDDIMDNSHTRRGQPCWFRVPKVGMIAVNDGVLLRNHIRRILRKHFRDKPYYVHLLDLFDEVEFQTASGQIRAVQNKPIGRPSVRPDPHNPNKAGLNLTTASTSSNPTFIGRNRNPTERMRTVKEAKEKIEKPYHRIVQYKTAYYSFYLPVACAMLSGGNLDNHIDVKNILVEMGVYFQVQDDYLDCFGDHETTGKIGTHIEDFKCSWLLVKALELSNEEQKKVLCDNYGKPDPANVANVKSLYKELDLQGVFVEYESGTYKKLTTTVEAHPSKVVQAVWKAFLGRIHKRKK